MSPRQAIVALVVLIIVGIALTSRHSGSETSTPSAAPKQMLPSEIRAKLIGTFTCVSGFMAARTPDDGERLKDLINDRDKAAIRKMVFQGRVVFIKKGAVVHVEDWDAWRNIETIHVTGEPDAMYTTDDAGRRVPFGVKCFKMRPFLGAAVLV